MADLIVFNVGKGRYALDIEHVQRIIPIGYLTSLPNAHRLVDGMMPYEDRVVKVMNFRKLVNLKSYEQELAQEFEKLKQSHQQWFDALHACVFSQTEFQKSIDPHKCDLGHWLDNFRSYDESISALLTTLMEEHKTLHAMAAKALEMHVEDQEASQKLFERDITRMFQRTMQALEKFTAKNELIANGLQKLIIYDNKQELFGIKVDAISDIAHVEENEYVNTDESTSYEFLELKGVLEVNKNLVNVIGTVKFPKA